jgi:DNA-binding NtrC family response regulator
VEFAAGGTLILDELLNLPPHAQRLLLDFTQFGTYRPLGYERAEPKTADVRIIAATNGDLHAAVRDGRFRQDLYHRLAGTVLDLPPLRARREEVPALAESALRRSDPSRAWKLSVPMRRLLLSQAIEWPGNVRQLETVMRRARERAIAQDPEADVVCPEHISPRDLDVTAIDAAGASPAPAPPPPETEWRRLQSDRLQLDEREATVIRSTLDRCSGVVAQAARELGIARTTLLGRMDSLGIRSAKKA